MIVVVGDNSSGEVKDKVEMWELRQRECLGNMEVGVSKALEELWRQRIWCEV